MDFNRNPQQVPGDVPFSPERLDRDVSEYLSNAGAVQDLPIDRLRQMNPLSIELYRRYKVDIASRPLEFAVNNQHMNGGVMVDTWGRSNLAGCYAVGEAAGTHGVTRPGGAALNSGQVFGTRVAEHISASGKAKAVEDKNVPASAADALDQFVGLLRPDSPLTVRHIRSEVQTRMSEKAGMICDAESVAGALQDARHLNARIRTEGIGYERAAEAGRALQWAQMAAASEAVLTALHYFISAGGGSRGARAICDQDGEALPQSRSGALEEFRFRKERDEHRDEQIIIQKVDQSMEVQVRLNRSFDENAKSFFERDWPAWLTAEVYHFDEN
jgi:aspartate oxidase